jgi:sarcosine oxidase delta subunit
VRKKCPYCNNEAELVDVILTQAVVKFYELDVKSARELEKYLFWRSDDSVIISPVGQLYKGLACSECDGFVKVRKFGVVKSNEEYNRFLSVTTNLTSNWVVKNLDKITKDIYFGNPTYKKLPESVKLSLERKVSKKVDLDEL